MSTPGRRLGSRASAWTGALGLAALAAACAHEERRAAPSLRVPVSHSSSTSTTGPPQYLLADPSPRGGAIVIPLGAPQSYGLVVDKARVVVGRGEPRVALDATDQSIRGAAKVPSRFGGGYLFWTDSAFYRSDAFDGALRPLVRVPDAVETIAFASKFVLVRTRNGERWSVGLPSGERVRLDPLGVADVEALDDGRALSFNDQGTVFASLDGGAHWNDVTAQVRSSPTRVASVAGELWLFESNGGASRLEPDGRFSWFDKQPPEKPPELRPRDARWRGSDAPLRTAFHDGAAVDDSTAIVVEGGDVVRIDVRSGEIVSVLGGRLPPDAQCQAVPTSGDVLFACTARASGGGGTGTSFVVSHTLGMDVPVIEQNLPGNAQFYASDDGGLAYAGPCGVGPALGLASSGTAACVRQPGGIWEEHDLSRVSLDGGTSDLTVARWVPRADGRVVALVMGPAPAILDPRTGARVELAGDTKDVLSDGPVYARSRKPHYARRGEVLVDTSWSFAGGVLRGLRRHGGGVEISEDGRVSRSAYAFEVVGAGAVAIGKTEDGRLYQTTDHGASWVEVAGPPAGAGSVELRSCTTAGCDLGAFYRVGWLLRPPRIDPPREAAAAVPEIRRAAPLLLACRPSGPASVKALARTESSPDDLGMGMTRLPVEDGKGDYAYVRTTVPRSILNPVHEVSGDPEGASLRAVFSGYQIANDSDPPTVLGPNKSVGALRRAVAYVAPFDTAGRIVKASIAMSDVLAAGRAVGMTTDEILSTDMTDSGDVVPVTPLDPSALSEIAVHNSRGMLAMFRGERSRVAMRPTQDDGVVVSGAMTASDEAAFLELEPSGVGHVFKMGPGGIVDLFDVAPSMGDAGFYPANPDAIAISSKGDVVVLRTPSGSDPPSEWDPAYVIAPSSAPVELAPWSQLKLADDPACKAETGGFRATLQLVGPWVRLTTPELRVVDEAPMLARVRWTNKRVCLEGVEVKLPNVSVRAAGLAGPDAQSIGPWLVAKGSTFARVAVGEGIEWRQPLECALAP